MPVNAPLPPPPASLDTIVQRAGGVRATVNGHTIVTSYGSPAGELAACVTAVGLADWSQLTKLRLDGPPAHVRELTLRMTGTELAPGGAVATSGAWWCAEGAGRTLVLCPSGVDTRLCAALVAQAPRHPAVTITDHTAEWAILAVVGRRTHDVLARLGIYGQSGDPRAASPVGRHRCGGVSAIWLLQGDDTAWAIVPRRDAASLWRAIERAGQPSALCAVGQDAVSRYALLGRRLGTR